MKQYKQMAGIAFALYAMLTCSSHAADVIWFGVADDHDWDNTANWVGGSLPSEGYGTSGDRVRIQGGDTNRYAAYTSSEGTRYYRTVEVGYSADGQLDVTGGTLIGDDGGDHYIGRAGNTAIVNISGGSYRLGASMMHVGTDSGSTAIINLSGGELVFSRETSGIGGRIGDSGGAGTLHITGGAFRSRAGIILGYNGGTGVFHVDGSGASQIGIGEEGTTHDGSWTQNSGSTLKVGIGSGGITPIHIIEQNGDGDTIGGDAVFHSGSLLEPGFIGGYAGTNEWTVLTWDGAATDYGLQLSTNVTDYQWGFYITNNALVVTYGYNEPVDLNQPKNLSAVASDDQVTLDWTSISNATGYNIKRSLVSGGPYATVGTSTTNHFVDYGLTSRTEYFYVVSAVTGAGESSESDEVSAITSGFVHPGGLFKLSDLERMRYQIEHRIDPWYSSFLELQSYSRAGYNYTVLGDSYTVVQRDAPYTNKDAFMKDVDAAYCNALMWMITQDTRHADKCVEIFNAWTSLTNMQGGGTESLNAGLFAWKLVEAAEIIKSTYSGWSASDIQAFKDMLVYPGYSDTSVPASVNDSNGTFYWRIYRGDSGRHSNQDAIAWRAMMTMGIFLDNEKMYQRALRYFTSQSGRGDDIPLPTGPSLPGSLISSNEYFNYYNQDGPYATIPDYGYNGALTNMFWENGQCQESSRDQAHTFFNLAIAAGIADVAWNQGDTVWNLFDSRLLKGFEYSARYNTSYVESFPDQPTPWEPTGTNFIQRFDRTGHWYSKKINPHFESDFVSVSRGGFLNDKRPIYEQAVAHFGVRMGMSTNDYLWTLRSRDVAIGHDGYETTPALAWVFDQPGWGAICFRRPALAAGDPISGFAPGGTPQFAIHRLSGTIEAENYDWFADDGEGHTYHDATSTNTGGAYRLDSVDIATNAADIYLTDLEAGEWVSYTVYVSANGSYGIKVRYAAADAGGTIRFSFGEGDVTTDVPLPSTGGMTDWTTYGVAGDLSLSAGVQAMRVHVGGTSNRFNLDRIEVVPMLDFSLNGSLLDMSWPSNHPGWTLESKTNLLEPAWTSIPGSEATNSWSYAIGEEKKAFFRLSLP